MGGGGGPYKVDARTPLSNGYWGGGSMNTTGFPRVFLNGVDVSGIVNITGFSSGDWVHMYMEGYTTWSGSITFAARFSRDEGYLLASYNDIRLYNRVLTLDEILALKNE